MDDSLPNLDSVVALTNLISQGASKMRSATRQPSIVSNMVLRQAEVLNREAQCGYHGFTRRRLRRIADVRNISDHGGQ